MQTRLSIILNEVFGYLIIFLLSFIWINYNISNFLASVALAVLLTAVLVFAVKFFLGKKQKKRTLTAQQTKHQKKVLTQLIFNRLPENLQFFGKVFAQKNIEFQVLDNAIILYPKSQNNRILFCPYFTAEAVGENVVVNTYKLCLSTNINRCLIVGNELTSSAQLMLATLDLNITFLNGDQTYKSLLLPCQQFPEITLSFKENKKVTAAMLKKIVFAKQNTKHYFYGGLITLIASLFVPLKTYYLFFSTLFLILAYFSFSSGKWQTKTPTNLFEPPQK